MNSITKNPIPRCHVVAIPYPGRGHINSMINFCKNLSFDHGLLVTFIVTEEWLGLIGSTTAPANMRLLSIPNVLPSELVRGAGMPFFFDAIAKRMVQPVERLLDRLDPPAGLILADTLLAWVIDVGTRRGVGVASLWTMSASHFSLVHHFDLVVRNGLFPMDVSENGDELVDYIPGARPLRIADIPPTFRGKKEDIRQRIQGAVSLVPKAKCLLVASFHALEAQVTDILRAKLPIPLYNVGPSIPYMALQNTPYQTPICPRNADYCSWLDSQPMGSVLYVSLGSYIMVSGPQMDEIALGLKASGSRFLWVARDDGSRLQEMSGEMGLVVPWCDQLKVLRHSSVGGFLSHCGWNSVMESIYAGKTMLTFPLAAEQSLNSKLIVEDWKVGIRLKSGENVVVMREEIARTVQSFMDLEVNEAKELRRKASELQKECRKAIEKGGSSHANILAFVEDVVQYD